MEFSLDHFFEHNGLLSFFQGMEKLEHLQIEKSFVMKDINISSRVFNHWINFGIVSSSAEAGDYRHTFSFVELLWLYIVKDLREYGLPLPSIKKIHQQLNTTLLLLAELRKLPLNERRQLIKHISSINDIEPSVKDEILNFLNEKLIESADQPFSGYDFPLTPLFSFLCEMLFEKTDIRLLINYEGEMFIYNVKQWTDLKLQDELRVWETNNRMYLIVSLQKYLVEFLQKKEHQEFSLRSNFLNKDELHILNLIKEGEAKELTITFQDKKPLSITITKEKKLFAEARLSDIILSSSYQEISIKTQQGQITYSYIKTTKKLK